MERKKLFGPFIITTAEDEVKIDESIEFDLRENRIIGFAVDTFQSGLNDQADDPKNVNDLEELVAKKKITPADLGQTFLLLVSLPDNSLQSYPLCVIGRSSRENNSYKDLHILELTTTVVSKWAKGLNHLYCAHSNDGNTSLITRNKLSKLMSNKKYQHDVCFIPNYVLENGVSLCGDPRHDWNLLSHSVEKSYAMFHERFSAGLCLRFCEVLGLYSTFKPHPSTPMGDIGCGRK